MYDPKSSKAEEFICHEEILETLAFAESKKQDKDIFYLMVLFHLTQFFLKIFFLMLLVLILKHLH